MPILGDYTPVPFSTTVSPRWLRVSAGLTLGIGLLIVAGWRADWEWARTFAPHSTEAGMNGAAALVLGAAGLLAVSFRWERTTRVLGAVLLGFATVILLELITGWPAGINRLFWTTTEGKALWVPGRIVPQATLAFLVVGLGFVFSGTRWGTQRLYRGVAGFLLGVGVLPLLHYTLIVAQGEEYRNMSLPVALGLLALGAGFFAWLRGSWVEKGPRVFGGVSVGLLLSIGLFMVLCNRQLIEANRLVTLTQESRAGINNLVSRVARMESTARAYGLTGGEGFGARVAVHAAEIRLQLDQLAGLVHGQPRQEGRLAEMRELAAGKITDAENLVQVRAREGVGAAAYFLANLSPSLTSRLVSLADEMLADEEASHRRNLALQSALENNIRVVMGVGGVLVVLVMAGTTWLSIRAARARFEAEQELHQVNELQRAVLDGSVFSVIATGPDGLIRVFNRGAEQMLGYTQAEMIGAHTPEIIHVGVEVAARAAELSTQLGRRIEPGFEAFVARARLGEVDEREWTYVRKDGRRLPVQLNVTALRDREGAITGFLGIAQDLTERKKAETALQASEERLGQVLGHAECLVWEARVSLRGDDWDWRMSVYPSALHRRLHGSAVTTEAAGLWYKFAIPEQAEMNQRCREAMQEGRPGYVQEFRLVNGSTVVWIRESVSIRPQGGGHFWLVGVAFDVTDRKQLETALRYSEEQFRNAFDYAGIGMALVGLDGHWLQANQILRHMLGYSEEELLARTFQDVTHPEDLQTDLANSEDLIAGRRRHYQMEKRYIHRDGHVVHVRLTVTLVRNADGAPQHFISQVEDITARHLAEQALIKSQRQLSDVFRSMAEGLVVHDTQGRIIECNAAAENILGLTRSQMMGLTSFDPRWQALNEDGTPCPGERHPTSITRMTGQPQRGIIMGVRKTDGSLCWVSVNTEAILDERGYLQSVVASFADVTERKRAAQALAESEERTRLFAEHAPASVAMFDREMRYLVHSAKWLKDYGLEGQPILGRSHYEVFPEIGEHWKDVHRRCLAGATEVNEADLFVRADGSRQWLSWRLQPWHTATGTIGGIVMFTEDITRRKQLEESLAQARDQALESSRMKSAFLANMSHEIRTPMNGVLGMAELLMDSPLNEEQRQMGRVIQNSARSLLTVIDDILDFSKIEAGKLSIEAREFDLPEQIDQALALLSPRAQARGLVLLGELPPASPPPLLGDPARLQQILVNLLGNAIKFTEQGGVTLVLAALPAPADGRYAFRLEVRDTGIGITAEQRQRLFQPFTQADDSMTRKYGGTGLGLAISRQLLELMGGRIGMSSEAGRGSVFWFELELPVAAKRPPQRPVGGSTAPMPRPALARVLVAEDNEANQLVIRLMLDKLGLDYDIVEDGLAALERVTQGGYAAILMDCQMPGLDGYETTRRIRAGSAGATHKQIPIFALTAHAMASDRQKCLEAGMDDYLPKPVRLDALQKALARFGVATASLGVPPAPPPAATESVLDAGHLAELRALPGEQAGESLLDVLARKSLEELPTGFSRLQNLADTQAGAELAQLAHRLAGSAASLGAMPLRTLLLSLEQAARRPDWTAVARHRSELDRQWRLLQDALRALRPPPTP